MQAEKLKKKKKIKKKNKKKNEEEEEDIKHKFGQFNLGVEK